MVSRALLASTLRTVWYCLILAGSVLVVGCSSGSGITAEDIERLEAGQEQVSTEIAKTNAEVMKLEESVAALTELLTVSADQLTELQKLFIQSDDGSAAFATATPVATVSYEEYGFKIPFPATVSPAVSGLIEDDASDDSGSLLASSGGVSLLLVWQTLDPPLTPQESVVGAFEILQEGTDSNFAILAAESDALEIDGQAASYGTFRATDDSGEVVGIALIGGWVCGSTGRSYAMAVTGQESEAVQDSFFYFSEGFECST